MESERTPPAYARGIKSYVLREGRLTPAQADALARLWPRYGLDVGDDVLDLDAVFGRHAPRVVEIGFGAGEHLLARAVAEPQCDFIGIEVHRPGVGRVLRELEIAGVDNVRVLAHDAVEVLRRVLPAASVDELVLYFPDPWPKKRHHKRRIVQPAFAELAMRVLVPGGLWRLATDWAEYAAHMREVLDAAPEFENLAGTAGFVERPVSRPLTRFERRGERLGHAVFDLVYRRR